MTGPEQLIASVLEEITMEAGSPRPLAESAWKAGRRHRMAVRTGLVVASAVIVAAAVVIPRAVQGAPTPAAAAPIELRVPLMLRPVAVIEDKRCSARTDDDGLPGWPGGAGDSAGPGQPSTYCFYLTGPAIVVTALEYARIASDGVGVQLRLRFPSGPADRLAALSKKLIHQRAPRNRIAIIVGGRVISAPAVVARIPAGKFWLRVGTRTYAEQLLRQLRGSRRGD
jgi:hypothetical protein